MVDVQARLTAIENRLTAIETLLKTFPEIFATKAELQELLGRNTAELLKAINEQTKFIAKLTWYLISFVLAFGSLLVSAVYFIATHVK